MKNLLGILFLGLLLNGCYGQIDLSNNFEYGGLDNLTLILAIIIVYILPTYVVFRLAKKFKRDPKKWVIGAVLTNPIIVLILIIIFGNNKSDNSNEDWRNDPRFK